MHSVPYQIRHQQRLGVDDKSRSASESGCKVFDVSVADPVPVSRVRLLLTFGSLMHLCLQLEAISFVNNYTAYLTVKARDPYGQWRPLVKRYKLMPSCHGELCAQKHFMIAKDTVRHMVHCLNATLMNALRVFKDACLERERRQPIALHTPAAVRLLERLWSGRLEAIGFE